MKRLHHKLILATLAATWAVQSPAQVAVVAAGQASAGQQSNQLLMSLYDQLESLQREVQDLRGVVEEQSYQIRRMEQEQRDRYLDLDRRLSSNMSDGATPGILNPPDILDPQLSYQPPADNDFNLDQAGTPAPQGPTAAGPSAFGTSQPLSSQSSLFVDTGDDSGMPQIAATPQNEQQIYRTALNLLLEENQYQQSIAMFRQYIDAYPNGTYLTNAYYWLGEGLILAGDYNGARDAFMSLINNHPNDPKTPGAYLKLGVVYSNLGDLGLARQVWQDLPIRYPDSAEEIRFARQYLDRL